MPEITFAPAVKAALKGRVAFCGPTGSGKTWTALGWAKVLGAKTVLIDTERGSAALYADHFTFDTLRIDPPYDPNRLMEALRAAEKAGYEVVIIDSLSHFWEGEGGVLEVVDSAAQRMKGNKYVAWGVGTPLQRHMIDTILGIDAHVLITMRSKMEYVQEQGENGKSKIVKLGMAPVQRNGVEYEFTLIGDLDQEHRMVVSKSRCDVLADQVIQPHREGEAAGVFRDWLSSGAPVADRQVSEALVAQLNEIVDDRERHEVKRQFIDRFGRPADLLASNLDAAIEWVAAAMEGRSGFKCSDCPAMFATQQALNGHQGAHSAERLSIALVTSAAEDAEIVGQVSDIEPGSEFDGPTPGAQTCSECGHVIDHSLEGHGHDADCPERPF